MTTLAALCDRMLSDLLASARKRGFGERVDIVPYGLQIDPDPHSVWQATKHLEAEGLIVCTREVGNPPICRAQLSSKGRALLEGGEGTRVPAPSPERAMPLQPEETGGVQVDVGIITIKPEEFGETLKVFPTRPSTGSDVFVGPISHRHYNLRVADAGNGRTYSIAIIRQVEPGNGEALAATRDLIDEVSPQLVVVVGIAGGAPSKDVSLGDIVLSTRVNDYSVSAIKDGKPTEYSLGGGPIAPRIARGVVNLAARATELGDWAAELPPRPPVTIAPGSIYGPQEWMKQVEDSLRARFEASEWRGPRFIDGPIASSDALIKDAAPLISWLTNARTLRAVEMESAGIYRAVDGRCAVLAIRALSDIVGFTRDEAWTRFACCSAAAFCRAYLRTGPIDPRPPRRPSAPLAPSTAPEVGAANVPSLTAEERAAASNAFQALTALAELVDRWKSLSALSSEDFQARLAELGPSIATAFREVSLRLPAEFEWLIDGMYYLLSQLRASNDSHSMFLRSNEGGAYARELVREFELARKTLPRQLLEVWSTFRQELKARANGFDARVDEAKLDRAFREVLAAIARIPNGSVEFADNPSLRSTALRAAGAGLLDLTEFGGKLVVRPKRI